MIAQFYDDSTIGYKDFDESPFAKAVVLEQEKDESHAEFLERVTNQTNTAIKRNQYGAREEADELIQTCTPDNLFDAAVHGYGMEKTLEDDFIHNHITKDDNVKAWYKASMLVRYQKSGADVSNDEIKHAIKEATKALKRFRKEGADLQRQVALDTNFYNSIGSIDFSDEWKQRDEVSKWIAWEI